MIDQIRGGDWGCDQAGRYHGDIRRCAEIPRATRCTPRHGIPALTVIMASLASCGFDGADAGEAVAVRDSAGIRIVENFSPAWPDDGGWVVDQSPTAVIGVLDGPTEYLLDRVAGAVRLSDGRILVGNEGSQELLLYDGDGVYLKRAGGAGGGPGEFATLLWAGRFAGDSIAAFDPELRRVSVFDTDLEFVRSIPAREIDFFSLMQGFLADRSFVVSAGPDSDGLIPMGSGRHRPPSGYYRFSPDGTPLDTLGPFPGMEVAVEISGDGGIGISADIPFGRGSHLVPAGDRFYFVDSAQPEIQVLDVAGALTGLVRAPHEPRPIGRAEIEAHVAYTVQRIEDAGEKREHRDEMLELAYPSTMPVFEGADLGAPGVRLDTRNHLWVQEYRWPRDEAPTWRVFDPDGHFLGTVRTPVGLDVRDIGEDYIVGVASDEFDVEQVRIHALRRNGAAAPPLRPSS